jgi:dTDP-4-amino-4,6-dideoxygalactose transaminase
LQPYFSDLGFRQGEYPNAESHYARSITIPLFAGLSEDQQDKVVGELLKMIRKYK